MGSVSMSSPAQCRRAVGVEECTRKYGARAVMCNRFSGQPSSLGVFYTGTNLEAVPVGQADGLFALPREGSPAHANPQAERGYTGRGLRRRQWVGHQGRFDDTPSECVKRVGRIEDIALGGNRRMRCGVLRWCRGNDSPFISVAWDGLSASQASAIEALVAAGTSTEGEAGVQGDVLMCR